MDGAVLEDSGLAALHAVRLRPFSIFALSGTEECLRQSTPVFAQMRNCRYAARWVVMIRDSSRADVPREISERISRSKETDGSPASILATRDWLD